MKVDADKLKLLLKNALAGLPGPEDTVLFLSGGIDSSLLACLLAGQRKRIRCLSAVAPGFPRYDEARYINAVANACPALDVHRLSPIDIDLIDKLSLLMRILKRPVYFSAGILWIVMCEEAKRLGAVNVISGLWPDELLGGYHGFLLAKSIDDLKTLHFKEAILNGSEYFYRCRAYRSFSPGSFLRDLSLCGFNRIRNFYAKQLPPDAIHPTQIAADYFGLNLFEPYVTPEFVLFCLSLPAERLVLSGNTKIILREVARDMVPDVIIDRREKYGTPGYDAEWFRRNELRIRGLKDKTVNREFNKFLKNPNRRYYPQLWCALSMACIDRC